VAHVLHQLVLSGDIDLGRAEELRHAAERFERAPDCSVQVDLSAVSFLDSTGLAFLARLARVAGARGGRVAVCAPCPVVRRVLEVSGLLSIVDVVDLHF